MTRYGIKFAQRGTPVSIAADYQTVLDTGWPLVEMQGDLMISNSLPAVSTAGFYVVKLFEHNLGFVPMIDFYPAAPLTAGSGSSLREATVYATETGVYAETLYTGGSQSVASIQIAGRLRVYTTDIRQEYKSRTFAINPTQDQENRSYGVKWLKERFSRQGMNENEYDYYSLNTNAKALAIHQTGTVQATGSEGFTISHNLGYLPTFFVYKVNLIASGVYTHPLNGQKYFVEEQDARVYANTVTIKFTGVQAVLLGEYAYMILKDPLLLEGA